MNQEMKNIIIFGSNGMLGSYLYKYLSTLYNVMGITRKDFEVTTNSITQLESFLKNKNDDVHETIVINCIGLIPQRDTTKDNSLYFLVNTVFPLALEKICQKLKYKLIHASTDCVFTGSKNQEESYIETDIPDEDHIYGLSKYIGEPLQSTVIRTSIIGEEIHNKRSFIEWVRNSKNFEKSINGYSNHYWNGVTCLQYCKIIDKIISENLFWQGIRHFHSPDIKSKYDLCCIIDRVYNCGLNINSHKTQTSINKTLRSIYNLNDIFNIPCIEEQIKKQSEFLL